MAAAHAWIDGRAAKPWIYIFGDVGTGKTHLAASALHEVIRLGGTGRFVSLIDLLGRMRRSFNRPGESDYDILEVYRATPFLVLDDFGAEDPTPWGTQTITDLVDSRYRDALHTIFTANFPVSRIAERIAIRSEAKAAERIVDRIVELAIPVPLGGPSFRK